MSKLIFFKQFILTYVGRLNIKRILFQTIWLKGRMLSGAFTPDQSGPGSDGNEGVLRIPQSSSITRTLSLDCFVS